MKTLECDILVVGAGPAGSSAARAAAGRGLQVLLVDRREKIGVPVQCAEFIPALFLGEVELPRDVVVQSVKEMRTILPGGEQSVVRAPGFTIRRDLFDQALADGAEKNGAKLLTCMRAVRMEEGGVVLRQRGRTEEERIAARVIIGADGPRSTVGRWIGSENRNLIAGVQWRVPLREPMDSTEVYFDASFYGGYAWLFPAGREANVGLGRKRREAPCEAIGGLLRRFVARLAEEGTIEPRPVRTTAGWIPAEPVRKVARGKVLLVGDAAGHTHPITGAGVSQAVMGGRMAGEWAARAVEAGDPSLLGGYEREWRELFGEAQERAHRRRQALEENWGRLEAAVKKSWVAFSEYYADP